MTDTPLLTDDALDCLHAELLTFVKTHGLQGFLLMLPMESGVQFVSNIAPESAAELLRATGDMADEMAAGEVTRAITRQ